MYAIFLRMAAIATDRLGLGSAMRALRIPAAILVVAFMSVDAGIATAAEISIVQVERRDGSNNGYRADLGDYSPGSNLADDAKILCNLRLSGDIAPGDYNKLVALLPSTEDDLRLCLDSKGGDYAEALRIAEMLIDRTVGTAIEANAVCYSSCAIVFMSGSGFAYYKLNMFLHVEGKLGFHAPYITNVPQGAYDSKTVENAFSAAVLAIRKLMKLDPTRFSASFLTQMLEKGPGETFDIDTVGKVVEHRISLYGGDSPKILSGRNLCFACFYDLRHPKEECDDPPGRASGQGLQYVVDTFRGGECVAEVRTQNARVTGWRLVTYTYETAATLPYWYLYPANTPITHLALGGSAATPAPPASPSAPARSFDGPQSSIDVRILNYIEAEYLRDLEEYAPYVDYYDKGIVDQAFIAKDKSSYARRWPQRQYRMVPGSLRIGSRNSIEHVVTFEYTYVVANGPKRRSGRGSTQVVLRDAKGQFLVVGVKEVVQK